MKEEKLKEYIVHNRNNFVAALLIMMIVLKNLNDVSD